MRPPSNPFSHPLCELTPCALCRYLHQSNCAHKNLDADSYLVTADFRVKVSAFGAAQLFDSDYGNAVDMASEFADDVFDFGGVVWEVGAT